MGWRHGHSNERRVQFSDRGRRRNHKHCRLVGRPPRYLRAGTRRERLPGLPDLGADQCGVPGCDWKCNTNPNSNRDSDGSSNGDTNSSSNGDTNNHAYLNTEGDANAEISAYAQDSSDSGAKTLIRYRATCGVRRRLPPSIDTRKNR